MKIVNIITAVSENNVIGINGHLPWSIPEDWDYFLEQTKGDALIVGRKSFEEMLKGGFAGESQGRFYVLTRSTIDDDAWKQMTNVCVVSTGLKDAIQLAQDSDSCGHKIWICGGQSLYGEAVHLADLLYITRVKTSVNGGDTFFPTNWEENFPYLVSKIESSDDNYEYTFFVYSRSNEHMVD